MKKDKSGDTAELLTTLDKYSTYTIISDTARLLDDQISHTIRQYHLQSGARRVLAYLSIRDGVSQLDLIRATHLKAPTISLIVQKMERDGLITRKTDDLDMRMTRVFLTDKGTEVNTIVLHETALLEDAAMADFTAEERNVLRELMKRICVNMDTIATD